MVQEFNAWCHSLQGPGMLNKRLNHTVHSWAVLHILVSVIALVNIILMDDCSRQLNQNSTTTHTHTHIRLTALCPGLPRWANTRKVKPISILLKQETVSGRGISWAVCKSAPRSRQITMPAPHHSVFLQAECPSCHPTNSVKALKEIRIEQPVHC